MSLEPFKQSEALTFGVELELQLVNRHDYDLAPFAPDLLRALKGAEHAGDIKPEISPSMIEISTGICHNYQQALQELTVMRDLMVAASRSLNLGIAGGGTHPFQQWSDRTISDSPRYQYISELYGYLAKQFTVFGQHVHIGCPSADESLFLLHAIGRYVPHFVALAASSPYVQGVDTGFASARLNSVAAFPMSGRAPFLLTWDAFTAYFEKMRNTGVIESMKDFYWDIRPKPEFGTIEVRVMDTPLTVQRACDIAAYIQMLARYLLLSRPFMPQEDDYLVYTFNRFQACRFGLEGEYVHPNELTRMPIADHILSICDALVPHAEALGSLPALANIRALAERRDGDAHWLRQVDAEARSQRETVRKACDQWAA
ncbi:YbdK family carboxylate-amine ligase [Cupriavidus taiwanensis]|uniref:Putative glutamate--cysteine ligase 2 n=1 Tax=Cupriavidus taiwanensis TaxID=164546 RepID=A0A7Z7J7E7_9BURK|nr:YbdK family carboxylate-amine ligase [Cupriavidus taiwanensis]SOY90224.1 ATP-dependent carboxylate-amine ligase [Cupriavidus taiwanensis]SOZ00599.1 ATP-dependent carboxylate-amine ligase [Cupriavidus taiwanensis]SOZ03683.1 ATP-dependent carboxylate-amine ligase [Cupriavidus taiwanensis]SPC07917.1 ATP-dependent carboxylate-amine ligase [Cupriavidus taiwanensis]SPD42314.1 putative glutamate--cysteine ligase 2 [Cupriavidus taiwanensis]